MVPDVSQSLHKTSSLVYVMDLGDEILGLDIHRHPWREQQTQLGNQGGPWSSKSLWKEIECG